MGACWGNQYAFERGEVVKVKTGHPFAGKLGVIDSHMGDNQFEVILPNYQRITVFTSMVEKITPKQKEG